MKYVVLYERTGNGYSAHVPDLPGCIAAAATLEETRQLMKEAIEFHLEGMRLHGEHIPPPVTVGEEVEVPVPA
jgi:predicted RNase H-like HicB family nuclease